MPQPTASDVHVNQPLTSISVAFLQEASNFVASRVFPNIPVSKQSDRYYEYDRGFWNRAEMKKRAPGTRAEVAGYKVDSSPTYYCEQWSLRRDIPDPIRANADQPLNLDREATLFLSQQGALTREKEFASTFMATSVWATDIAGVSAAPGAGQVLHWNDAASTPIENIRAGKLKIMESTGYEPNKLVLGAAVWNSLIDHPDIVDRVKYGQTPGSPAVVTRQAVAAILEIESIEIMKGIENTADEGQTNVHTFIGGKKALLCYSAPSPGLMTPSAGYTFSWTGLMGAGAESNRIRTYRDDPIQSDVVEIDMAFALKKVAADLGYFFNTIVA